MSADPRSDAPTSITLHSSWTGIVSSSVGALLLAALAIFLVVGDGIWWVALGISAAALVGLLVVVFDLPLASEFSDAGVIRRTMGRRHHLEWSRVRRLRRHRVGLWRTKVGEAAGGLVAEVGGRHVVLVDQMESQMEFDALCRVLRERSEALALDQLGRPPEGRSPTWLWRRPKWKPDHAR